MAMRTKIVSTTKYAHDRIHFALWHSRSLLKNNLWSNTVSDHEGYKHVQALYKDLQDNYVFIDWWESNCAIPTKQSKSAVHVPHSLPTDIVVEWFRVMVWFGRVRSIRLISCCHLLPGKEHNIVSCFIFYYTSLGMSYRYFICLLDPVWESM